MAEILAVASGVAGLLSLTIEVYSTSSRYISCVKHASSAVLDVQRELKALKSILSELDKALEHGEAETLFKNRPSALSSIEDAEEYRETLRKLQVRLEKESSKTGFSAKLKSFTWPFNEERTQSILDVLRRHVSVFGQALSIDSYWMGADILREVQFLGQKKRHKMVESTLEWLSPAIDDMQPKQHDFFAKRVGTTGEWLLKHDVFRKWIDGPLSPILWCSGDPGTGKTILSSIIVNHIGLRCTPDGIAQAVVFCDHSDQANQSTTTLLGNIAKQLIQGRPSYFKPLEELHDRLIQRSAQPTVKDFEALIQAVCSNLNDTFIVVDALDELLPEHRKTLLPILRSFQLSTIKVLVTSRPHSQDIERAFRDQQKLVFQASDADIQQFVRTKVEEDEDLLDAMEDDEKLKEEIISATTSAAQGMILLPALQLNHLNGLFSKSQIRKALTTMPKDIFDMYSKTLDRIQRQALSRSELALTILGWISLAKRPLLIGELRHALAVEFRDDEDRKHKLDNENLVRPQLLIDVCAGLVTIEPESKVVRLVHFTTQEFLNKNRQSLFPGIPAQMAGTCLTYLLIDDFRSGPCLDKDLLRQRCDEYQFLEYASIYWGDHVRGSLEVQYLDFILELIRCDKRLCASVEACNLRVPEFFRWCNLFGQNPSGFGSLHCAAAQGLDEVIKVLLAKGADPCEVDGTFKTPVHWAAWRGHCSSLEILLDTGVDIHLPSEDGFTLLDTAVDQGREEATQILLDRGFDINKQGFGKDSALSTATLMGHESIVNLLLEKGANWRMQNQFGETALIKAALRGHEEILKILLNRGVDVQHANACGNTALHCAAFSGRSMIIKKLLEAGAEVDLRTINGVTPLHMAASQGHEEVIRLLVEKGANIEAKTADEAETFQPLIKEIGRCIPEMVRLNTCGKGATALFEAALHGQETAVKCLLQLGAEIATTNIRGESPLIAAAKSGMHNHLGGPRLPLQTTRSSAMANSLALLDHGADVNAVSNLGYSVLHSATSGGHLELIQLLLQNGADLKATAVNGNSVLHTAAASGEAETLEWLMAHGLDPQRKTSDGCTPFHLAAAQGNVETMKALLDSDTCINIEACDGKGLSPLMRSVWSKRPENVQFLLDRGADIDREAEKSPGVNLAYSAVHNEEPEILKLVIDRGARLDILSDVGTLLHLAAQSGRMKVLPILVERGLSPTAVTSSGKTPLHLAAVCGKTEAVQYLLDHGSEIDAVDNHGNTPLRLAAKEGMEDTVSLLCQRGANVNQKWNKGLTILDLALEKKGVAVARILTTNGSEKLNRARMTHHIVRAVKEFECSILQFLLENDDDSLARAHSLFRPFHFAAHCGDAEFAKFLVKKGFNVNSKNQHGASALSVAVEKKSLPVLEVLLENGAKSAEPFQLEDLVELAVVEGDEDIAICLVRHGIDFDRKDVLSEAVLFDMPKLAHLILNETNGTAARDIDLDEALQNALGGEQVGMCKLLLENGANPNSRNDSGSTALHVVCSSNHLEYAELLLEYGADIEARNIEKQTPLLCSKSLPITKLLVQRGADLKATDQDGWTALHFGVTGLREGTDYSLNSVLEFLISQGADLNVPDAIGVTPLHLACSERSVVAVGLLLAYGANVTARTTNGDQPLHSTLTDVETPGYGKTWFFEKSVEPRVIEILDQLLQHGAEINATGEFGHTALHRAMSCGSSNRICKWLLKNGADIEARDDQKMTPLLYACFQGDPGFCVSTLLGRRVDIHEVDSQNRTALDLALETQNWELADELIQHGVLTNREKPTLKSGIVHTCARNGYSLLLNLLLSWEPEGVHQKDGHGHTALRTAAEHKQLQSIQVLLKHGADPDI